VDARHPSSFAHPWIDLSNAPLFVLTYPHERSLGEVIAAHDAAEAVYRTTTGPLAWIVDGSQISSATAKERQVVVAYETRIADIAQSRCVGLGVVMNHAAVRGLYTAIRWIAPARYPQETFATYAGAERWVRAQLTTAIARR
jgi:hypothetical protein